MSRTNTKLDGTEYHFVDSIEEAWAMKRWLSENRREVIGVDTETSGLNPYAPDAKLRMVQLGDHKSGWAVPWEQWGGVAMECLNQWEGQFTFHNLAFDEKWLRLHADYQIPWERTHDTLIMHNMLYPGQPAGLKPITDKYIDPRASMGGEMLKKAMKDNNWDWSNIPVDYEAYAMYSAMDPVLAAHIYSHLRADLKEPKSYDLEMATLRICAGMEDRGVPVDVEYCEEQRDLLDKYVEDSKKWALEEAGVKIGSTQSLAKYFEDTLGATIVKRTPGGAPSVDKDTLDLFSKSEDSRVSEFAKFVLNVRKADKIRGSYLENFIKDQTDGVLHANIKTMQAVTGRMSITNPALQTLGKSDTIVRNAIVPRGAGEKIVSADLDQVEFRIFAHLSEDEALIETFTRADATGSDAFTEIGRQIYGDDFQKSDPRRTLVKGTIYGRLYGSGVAKMAATAGVPFESMKAVSDALNAQYPGIDRYQKSMEAGINARKATEGQTYIRTGVTDRKIPVDEDRVYAGLNYTIQSTAAEVFKNNLVKMDNAGLSEFFLVPVHDEIVMSVPDDLVQDVMRETKQHMTTTDGWAVPLSSDAEGPYERWGAKYGG